MIYRLTPWLRAIAIVLVVGGAISVAGFLFTSQHKHVAYLGPLCARDIAFPGFDPWSGAPHGRIYEMPDACPPMATGTTYKLVVAALPKDMIGRQAIPLPVSFVAGCAIAVVGVVVVGLGRRRLQPGEVQRPA